MVCPDGIASPTMRNHIALHTHHQWVQSLSSGLQTDGLFRLSPSLAQRLIPTELTELRRDLVHCLHRQQELTHALGHQTRAGRETHEQGVLRRRLLRQREQETRLRADIFRLTRGMLSLTQRGGFLPPPPPVAEPPEARKEDPRAWAWVPVRLRRA